LKAVLVTGASTGIGRATAIALAERGFRVFAGVRRESDGEALRAAERRLEPIRLDVADAASRASAAASLEAALGDAGLFGLVNNAGIAVGSPIEFLGLDRLREQLEVNVVGLVGVSQLCMPMLRRARGRIVHIGSSSGYLAAPLMGAYSASKYAVEAIADSQRRELRGSGVEVALVEPGSIATPIWDKGVAQGDELVRQMPARAIELYGPAIESLRQYARDGNARSIPAERVADAVVHALTAARPRTRYRVGTDAKLQWWLTRILPDRVVDAIVARFTRA